MGGKILVHRGDQVEAGTVLAKTFVPGRPHLVDVAHSLNIQPAKILQVMVKGVGERVEAGEVIARHTAFFGLVRRQCKAPAPGVVDHISVAAGQVTIREAAMDVEIRAFISGVVTQILPGEGVVVETPAALVQGKFGQGGEAWGQLRVAVRGPADSLTARQVKPEDRGRILVAGQVSGEALKRAAELGVAGIVCASIQGQDLPALGEGDASLTLVVTEGFGKIPMPARTFSLLKKLEGKTASITGSPEQGMRPEVIVPQRGMVAVAEANTGSLEVGARVRITRLPWFGQMGTVRQVPGQHRKLESEAVVRVLEVQLDHGDTVLVPLKNVEIIAE